MAAVLVVLLSNVGIYASSRNLSRWLIPNGQVCSWAWCPCAELSARAWMPFHLLGSRMQTWGLLSLHQWTVGVRLDHPGIHWENCPPLLPVTSSRSNSLCLGIDVCASNTRTMRRCLCPFARFKSFQKTFCTPAELLRRHTVKVLIANSVPVMASSYNVTVVL